MHDTALAFGAAFFACYLQAPPGKVLDVGAQDINGSLRHAAPPWAIYTGVDITAGPGVDLVLEDPHRLPFPDAAFDAVVSTSCFEHDPMFWVTFLEMLRVTRPGGHVYVNAPANGWYHRHPQDNWRFYPDAGLSLRDWGRREGHDVTLVESFTGRRAADVWNDCVMVFRHGPPAPATAPLRRISDRFLDVMNLRLDDAATPLRLSRPSEDQALLQALRRDLAAARQEIADLRAVVEAFEAALV